ncbi:protein MMS22-like [Ochlerotatus camptorhynchus]|uniref:protein MMS22-like n=1 Tax=Ochlerotatus camptorhynchus TaxID=644619 RepID=UPI0031DC739E
MFNCKQSFVEISRFVGDDVRQLVDVDRFQQNYSVPMSSVEDSPVQLFGIEFYYMDEELLQQLVRSARDTIGKLAVDEVRRDLGDSECGRKRSDVNMLFRVILGQIVEFNEKELLDAIFTLQDSLPDFIGVVEDAGMVMIKELSLVSYEFLHAVLDWRWLGLLLNFEMQKVGMALPEYEGLYLDVLVSLVRLALLKYNKIGKDELPTENQFYCPCTRKMWIAMMTLSESESNKLDFWNCLQKALETVQLEKQEVSRKQNKMHGLALTKANDFLFQTWMMSGIASLYQYHMLDNVSLKETPVIRISADYTILDRAIKEVIQGEKSEEQLRAFLLLLKPIYCQWWPIKHDFLVTLWDYFNKRLNSPFQLPSEALSKLACINRSPTGFIEQANYRASQEAFNALDSKISSYKCYLTLIAFMLRHYSESNQKTKVQILFNRTILKMAPVKLDSMTEQGIYNFSLLMLTMMEATPYQDDYLRLSKQLLQFKLDQLSPSAILDSTIRRITTIVLVNMALIIAFNQRGYDKANHLQQFLESLDEACRKYGDRLQPSLHVLAEGMCVVYGRAISKGEFEKGEEKFVGAWLGKYLNRCSEGERDAVLDIFARLFDCFRSKQLCRVDNNSDDLQPLYEVVLPYVKDAFNQPTNPCLLIADLAAHFTLFSTGQSYATPFMAMFTYFVDNVGADINLRLHYIKLIVKSDRIGEIEEKLLVRSWLKFALLNGREQLRDLSQAVNRMKEFRSLCEIPEYDLCDGDEEPIGLFFKFVGKKYREFEGKDNRAQYDITIKLHALFQHFDKWITNPSVVILRRVMTVLALALKECGSAIYIKSNPTCLYHVAFNQYFLPITVLTDRNVSNDVILAMGKVWHRIMDAVGQMNYTSDPVISDHVTNMMVKWAPQFSKFKDKNDAARPFVTFFSSHNEPFITFAFNRYLFAYVELQGALPKANAESGMKMLLYLLGCLQSTQDNGKIALFIRLNASTIMDHAMICHDSFPSKVIASELVFNMLDCTHNNSNLIKLELKNCLSSFTKKNLPMETGSYFRFMYNLADRNPEFIKSIISTIRSELTETERLRGGGEDKHLRRLLLQLEGAVEASFAKQKV